MPRLGVLVLALMAAACTDGPLPPDIVAGTWGGTNAGLIVNDSGAHVHIGCTVGDVAGPIHLDADGRFSATGQHNINAYPVSLGILHPALFRGVVLGNSMLLTVALTDTAVTLGPVTLTLGATPQMGPCPICTSPREMSGMRERPSP